MINDFIGIPWSADGDSVSGCSCWGLVRLFYRAQFGIELPDIAYADQMHGAWSPVEISRFGDVLLFRRGPMDRHVAIAINDIDMLHVDQDKTSCIENFRGPLWSNRLLRIYRHKQTG